MLIFGVNVFFSKYHTDDTRYSPKTTLFYDLDLTCNLERDCTSRTLYCLFFGEISLKSSLR